jgi:hypothetical protein
MIGVKLHQQDHKLARYHNVLEMVYDSTFDWPPAFLKRADAPTANQQRLNT